MKMKMEVKEIKFYSVLFSIACSIGLFASCEKEPKGTDQSQMLTINAEITKSTKTPKGSFEKDDALGLFIKDSNNQNYNECDCSFNLKSTYSGTDWQLSEAVMLSEKKATLYAYYPYSATLTDCTALPIEACTQTDYLYASPIEVDATNSKASLAMKHALSLAKFNLLRGEYTGAGQISSIILQQVIKDGTLNTHTGAISAGKIGNDIYTPSEDLLLTNNGEALPISIITIPMAVTTSKAIFCIDNVNYSYKIDNCVWESGKETTYTLSIDQESKTLLSIENVSIEPWGTGGSYEGTLMGGGFDVDVEGKN